MPCFFRQNCVYSYPGDDMNFIVLDLEWNQSPDKKEHENPHLPFEIIQIGAVKLDQDFNIIDQFFERIRPVIYPEIHYKIQEIIQINYADYKNARSFPEVAEDFFSWCGPDCFFCTWGPCDLTELQRNLKYYQIKSPFRFPLFFYDIQKIFSIVYEDRKTRRNLEFAVDFLLISKDRHFHDALCDAFYTGMVMRHLVREEIFKNYSIDCYQPPATDSEQIYAVYETYSKYISKPFDSRLDAMQDNNLTAVPCHLCQKNAHQEIAWFVGPSKSYYCLAKCKEHGYLKGKIRFKKTDDGKIFCIRILKQVSPETALKIREMQKMMREKKQLKHREETIVSHNFH